MVDFASRTTNFVQPIKFGSLSCEFHDLVKKSKQHFYMQALLVASRLYQSIKFIWRMYTFGLDIWEAKQHQFEGTSLITQASLIYEHSVL